MMYGYGSGWGWMMLMPLLWVGLVALIVWAGVRLVQRPGAEQSGDDDGRRERRETPQEILDRRLASGEIDLDAYEQRRERLAGRETRAP
jgi:putative membrane protein